MIARLKRVRKNKEAGKPVSFPRPYYEPKNTGFLYGHPVPICSGFFEKGCYSQWPQTQEWPCSSVHSPLAQVSLQ